MLLFVGYIATKQIIPKRPLFPQARQDVSTMVAEANVPMRFSRLVGIDPADNSAQSVCRYWQATGSSRRMDVQSDSRSVSIRAARAAG